MQIRRPGAAGPVPAAGAALVLSILACGPWASRGGRCLPEGSLKTLPAELREASGVAASRRHAGVYWTVEDSGPGMLRAVDADGTLLGSVEVPGGLGRDREALALGPCGSGDCLYVADVGDNARVRSSLAVYRIPEPDPADDRTDPPDVFRFSLPDGPRDIEAVFLLPGERLHLVSKGGAHPPTVYRYPGELRPEAGFLQAVQRLDTGPRGLPNQITGADASADGSVVVLRTYRGLAAHRIVDDTLATAPELSVDLLTLREPQGEGVALAPEGRIVLVGEAGPLGRRGSIAVLRCEPPLDAADG